MLPMSRHLSHAEGGGERDRERGGERDRERGGEEEIITDSSTSIWILACKAFQHIELVRVSRGEGLEACHRELTSSHLEN